MKKAKKNAAKKSSNMVPVRPLGDRVVVKPLSADEMSTTTASGIIIPDTAQEKPEQGRVVAVGEGKWNEDGDARIPISVKVGEKVLFSKYGFDTVKVAGIEYYVIEESRILAIITN